VAAVTRAGELAEKVRQGFPQRLIERDNRVVGSEPSPSSAQSEVALSELVADAEALAEALRLAVAALLESEGKPPTGPGADLAVADFLAQARYRGKG
jgi:hypothetical protein